MILLPAILLITMALPALAAPDLSQALARVSEARARIQASRAKLHANSPRSHLRASRPKRQQYPGGPPPPAPETYEDEEPTAVHICSLEEGDGYARSAEDEPLGVVQTDFNKQRPNSKAPPAWPSIVGVETEKTGQSAEEVGLMRDAEAHHSHFHHQRFYSPIVNPGLHIPPTQISPGVNLNINHNHGINSLHTTPQVNQGLNSGLHTNGFLNRGIQSSLGHQGLLPIVPSQSVISSQTQPLFNLRQSGSQVPGRFFQNQGSNFPQGPLINGNLNRPLSNNQNQFLPHFPQAPPIHRDLNRPSSFPSLNRHPFNFPRLQAENPAENEETDHTPEARTHEKLEKLKLKKLMKKLPTYYVVYPQNHNSYPSYYRESNDEEPEDGDVEDSNELAEDEREASPTHKKHKKTKFVPIYVQPQHYGSYREAETVEAEEPEAAEEPLGDEREANPTHKHKKTKFVPIYVQPQHYASYRDAEEPEARDADPTHGKKRKPKTGHFREAEDSDSLEDVVTEPTDFVSSNFLFDFPNNGPYTEQYKRSLNESLDQLLAAQRQVVDSLNATSDEDLRFLTDIANRTLSTVEEHRKMKRSIPITRLITDPRVKLDVPKTIENFGTATKNSFEDERAPMYHFKQMLGSSKNAFLSAMRIPPQNMIIPSEYEIVKSSEIDAPVRRNSPEEPFARTFNTVGQMVRESIKSGQEAAAHLGDAAHSARNILNTARHAAPRLIIPYSQIPAIQDTRLRKPSKAILITPRIVDFAEEALGRKSPEAKPNFVRLGHLMDAVGISKPEPKSLDLQKIIFEPKRISEGRVSKRLEHLYGRFRDPEVKNALHSLEDAKISVGAKNLKEFLVQMRGELTDFVHPPKHKKKSATVEKKKQQKEMGKFIENLFDGQEKNDEVVGQGLALPPELMRPFMGRATNAELHTFLRDNGDDLDNSLDRHAHHEIKKHSPPNDSDLGYVLGAINPMMFERLYNQTVQVRKNDASNPEDLFRRQEPEGNGTVGTSMALTKPLMTPFMGQARPEQVSELLDTYNNGDSSDYDMED